MKAVGSSGPVQTNPDEVSAPANPYEVPAPAPAPYEVPAPAPYEVPAPAPDEQVSTRDASTIDYIRAILIEFTCVDVRRPAKCRSRRKNGRARR